MAPLPFVADLPQDDWNHFTAGYASGYAAGLEAGREQSDAEAATAHARAHHVVQSLAQLDSHEVTKLKARIRTLEAAERNRTAATPWPDEHLRSAAS